MTVIDSARTADFTRGRVAAVVVAVLALLMPLLVATPASALIEEQDFLVSDNPVEWTPHVIDGEARIVKAVGSRIYVAGDFQQVQDADANGGAIHVQPYLFAFDRATGRIDTGFRPAIDDVVEGLAPSADGQSLYMSGYFQAVNGVRRLRTAKLNAVTGAVRGAFDARANSRVNEIIQRDGRVFIAGNFSAVNGEARSHVAEVDPTTGATLDSMSHQFGQPSGGGALSIRSMDVSPDGSRLVAVGNFGTVDGQARESIVQLDVSTEPSTLFDWQTSRYGQDDCFSVFDTYMRDVEFSPDGSYFVVSTTGGGVRGTLCDTAARWETAATGSSQVETWANSTGGDTLLTSGVTGDVVYLGGHQRWQNNPFGRDFAGPGAVFREGIAAVDARNGVPFNWDPGRNRGVGLYDFLSGSEGLYAVSDTDRWARWEYHGRLALFPTEGASQLPDEVPGQIPGTLLQLSPDAGVTNPGYLYRINAGGAALGAGDGGIDWAGDTSSDSPFRNSGSNAAGWGSQATPDSTVPSTTPIDVFSSERWDPSSGEEMQWEFPVDAGTDVQVRLYFANRCTCTDQPGERIFDVAIDGQQVIDDLDLTAVHGDDVGTMYALDITSDGLIDIDFGHVVENPLVNAIEIVDPALLDDGDGSSVDARLTEFDGDQTGTSTTIGGDDFNAVRGAFMISGELFAAFGNGTMTRQSFDGSTFSTPSQIDLNGLTSSEFPVSSLTGLSYDPITGRVLYTVSGNSNLFHRGFLPESGIVSAENIVSQGPVAGIDWSQVTGLHLSPYDNDLYFGTTDGSLHRIGYVDGQVTGTPETLSGPTTDTHFWRRGLTVYAGDDILLPNQSPTAAITATCVDGDCSFSGIGSSDPDGDIVDYSWDFGDGTTANGASVTHTFAEGEWAVTLTVTDGDGATGETTEPVSFGAEPTPVIDASCIGFVCTFDGSESSDAGDPVAAWVWDFGDGNTDAGEVVEHEYAAAGTYTVELTATDDEGAAASTTTDVVVDELDDSISWVGSDSETGQFDEFSVTVPGNVEDGDLLMLFVSSGRPGVGDATPTGVDGWANEDTVTNRNHMVAVWSQIADGSEAGQTVSIDMEGFWTKADVTVAAWRGVDPGTPLLVSEVALETETRADHTTPTASIDGNGAWVVSYWTDRTSATTAWTAPTGVTVRHEGYTEFGGRASALIADSDGAVAPGPIGGLTATADSANDQATMWTFALAPSTFEPLPEEPPVASFTDDCTDLSCSFDASASTGTDDEVVSWEWDFGDGSTDTGETVNHGYTAEGTYTVALTVTDGQGLTDTTTVDVAVAVDPVASFSVLCTDLDCSFDGSASTDAGDAVVSWDWDFGDGSTDTGETVNMSYAAEGTYTVDLTVVDDEGVSASASRDVTVQIGATPEPPVALFTDDCTDLSCSFDASPSTGTDDEVVSWEWDFGDGSTDTGETVNHGYTAEGTYTVALTVTDGQGLTDTTTVDVAVAAPPSPDEIAWVGSDSQTGQRRNFTVTVPGDVVAGDLLMLFVSSGRPEVGDETPIGLDGWANEDTLTVNNHTVTVWSQVADGSEAGQDVTVDMEGLWTKADVTVAVWRGVDVAAPLLVSEGALETVTRAEHITPEASVSVDGAWVVSYWTDRTSSTTSWSSPAGVTVRHEGISTGGGRATALLGDSNGSVSQGTIGGLTAVADSSNYQATMWTFALAPG